MLCIKNAWECLTMISKHEKAYEAGENFPDLDQFLSQIQLLL